MVAALRRDAEHVAVKTSVLVPAPLGAGPHLFPRGDRDLVRVLLSGLQGAVHGVLTLVHGHDLAGQVGGQGVRGECRDKKRWIDGGNSMGGRSMKPVVGSWRKRQLRDQLIQSNPLGKCPGLYSHRHS